MATDRTDREDREITGALDALTDEELDRVLQTCTDTPTGHRNLALILLMADSGLRIAEALALEPRDIVRQAGQITHVIIRQGKGGKTGRQPVTVRTAVALAQWEQERAGLGIGEYPIFCTISEGQATGHAAEGQQLEPGKRLQASYVRNAVKRLGRRAGLGDRLHPHLLRHTAITRYLRGTGNLELTRKFARHANIQTTAQIYSHLVQADVENGMAQMERTEAAPASDPQGGLEALTAEQIAGMAGWTPEQIAAFARGLRGEAQ